MAKHKTLHKDKLADSPVAGEIVRANLNRVTVSSDQFVSLYVNDTQVQVTPWDFRFIVGVIDGVPTPNEPTIRIKQTGEIRMSPSHAKKVAQVLLAQLANYEEKIGPIPTPED